MVRLADPHGELPIKNHKYVKNCTELYLAQCGIQKLASFDAFVNLEVLWVNDNEIEALDGLDQCFRIKSLHAHNNRIRSLEGSSLAHFKFLEELRLYGNKLKDLQSTLRVLARLQHLHDLDLFGNPVAEEEGYRYLVIAAIPSLRVLDRHAVTDEDRDRAARVARRGQRKDGAGPERHQVDDQLAKQAKSSRPVAIPGASPQQISGTVRLLMKDVAAIKRDQQQRAIQDAQRELQELERTRQQTLSASASSSSTRGNSGEVGAIPGLDEWETSALKKFFQSLEDAKDSGIRQASLGRLQWHLRTRGFELRDERGTVAALDKTPTPEPIKWADLLQLLGRRQVQCKLMEPALLRREANACFDKCQVLQSRLQSLSHDDDATMAELQRLSQQGYRLQALADSSSPPPSKSPAASRAKNTQSMSDPPAVRTRFCFTTFARETLSPSTAPDHSSSRGRAFLDLKAESSSIDESLRQKYKLQGKDFHKYMMKQGPQPPAALVRRRVDL